MLENAGFNFNKIKNITSAIELGKTIDELTIRKITPNMLDIGSIYFLPEHWKQRTMFLKIVINHWENILQDASLEDTLILPPLKFRENSSKNLELKKIFAAQDIFEEADIINDIVEQNKSRKICIFCPNVTLLNLIRINLIPNLYTEEVTEKFKRIMKIIEMETGEYKHENITVTKQIPQENPEILILAGMNENCNKLSPQSNYWLHNSLRKQLGINIVSDEIIFQNLINSSSEIFITFSKKLNGLNVRKSSLITKFIKDNDIEYMKSAPKIEKKTKLTSLTSAKNFDIDDKISAKSIEMLAKNGLDFYIKNTINLTPFSYDEDKRELRNLCKKLLMEFFSHNKNHLENTMENIADIDFYKFQHCKNIIFWLENNYAFLRNNKNFGLSYECNFKLDNQKDVRIYTDVDLLYGRSLYFFRLFKPKLGTSDIIIGNSFEPMVTALITQKNLGPGSIKELNIFNMHGVGQPPVDVTTIEISDKTIESFEERLRKLLSNNIIDDVDKSEKYKHFKRTQ